MTKDIVYKATVTTSNTNSIKDHIDMTASTFKEKYRNHRAKMIVKHIENNDVCIILLPLPMTTVIEMAAIT